MLAELARPDTSFRSPGLRLSAARNDDAADLALLGRRIEELKAIHRIHGLVLPEVLLPGQRMRLSLMPEAFAETLHTELSGVLGIRPPSPNEKVPSSVFSHGVEVRAVNISREFTDSGYGDASRWSATLVGGRVFEFQEPLLSSATPGQTFQSDVRWVDLGLSDQLSAARSPSRTVELAARELGSLVKIWLELVRGGGSTLWGKSRREAAPSSGGVDPLDAARRESVVSRMLADLGEMPGVDQPSERALWVAALINPCGADGGAWPVLDIRLAVLTASTPLERLSVAKTGMVDSIYKLKGGFWPMNTYYW